MMNVLTALLIPIISFIIWFNNPTIDSISPINQYLLITGKKLAKGEITKIEEFDDFEESNDSKTITNYRYCIYYYNFKNESGVFFEGTGRENGDIPSCLSELSYKPYKVLVEYIPGNPKISMVKEFNPYNSIFFWFKYTITKAVCVFLIYFILFLQIYKVWEEEYLDSVIISNIVLNWVSSLCFVMLLTGFIFIIF